MRIKQVNININFDFRDDVTNGKDPDIHSEKLREYHKTLWSKPLPSGVTFSLTDSVKGKYLYHQSSLGEFSLSSDSISHSYIFLKRFEKITSKLNQKQKNEILRKFSTIGGYIIFPSNKIDNKITINGARGFLRTIIDRFDLTLECIRRYYLGLDSPLYETLMRYEDFFTIFDNFRGYIDYFLLQDLVSSNYEEINFFSDFDDSFPANPFPKNFNDYCNFIENIKIFVTKRGLRMI